MELVLHCETLRTQNKNTSNNCFLHVDKRQHQTGPWRQTSMLKPGSPAARPSWAREQGGLPQAELRGLAVDTKRHKLQFKEAEGGSFKSQQIDRTYTV